MAESKLITSKEQLLRFTAQKVLPKTLSGLLSITDKLAQNNVVLKGEALIALGQAFQGLSDSPLYTFEKITNHLEPLLRKTDEAHKKQLISLCAEIASFDLPDSEKGKIYNTLITSWNEQVKQEKSIWGSLAKIATTVAGGVVLVAAASIAHEHSREKTWGDAANKLIDKF